MKAVMAAGWRPDRQDGEGLVARWATTAPDTDEIVNIIVRLLTALAVADDRSIPAQRAPAGQQGQWKRGHPRIDVVFGFGQCDKENQRLA